MRHQIIQHNKFCSNKWLLLKPGPRPWTRTLDQDPELGPWTQTLRNLDSEKPGPSKSWTLKNLDPEKLELWKTWTIKKHVKQLDAKKKRLEDHMI